MAKEIPYFKFYTGEWFTGDIVLEDYETQGLFINMCAFYWSKDCYLTIAIALKKFKGCSVIIDNLIAANLIKSDGVNISISFLDEQFDSKEVQKITNRVNGSKGGRPKKPNGFNLGYENETETKPNDNPNNNQGHNPNITNIKERKEEERKGKERKEDMSSENQKSDLIEALVLEFGFSEMKYSQQKSIIFSFVKNLEFTGMFDHFIEQYKNYKLYKNTSNEKRHSFESLIGTPAMQFDNAQWNKENWAHKLAEYNSNPVNQTKFQKLKNSFNTPNPYEK